MSIYERINSELPRGGEFWKSSTRDTLIASARKLLALGLSEEQAFDIISDVYDAASDEFGD